MINYKRLYTYIIITFIFIVNINSQDFGKTVIYYGSMQQNDPFYLLRQDYFYDGPCSFNQIYPMYGPTFMWVDSLQVGLYTYDIFNWGWGNDQLIYALTENGRQIIINQPRNIAMARYIERRRKLWTDNGQIYVNDYIPRWTLDGAISYGGIYLGGYVYFPDQKKMDVSNGVLTDYSPSRRTNNNWNFNVWDHPGLNDLPFWYTNPYHPDPANCGLFYMNAIARFYDGVGNLILPDLGYNIKILLGLDFSLQCDSGFVGNAAFGWGSIDIPDWQYPPNGIQLP